MLALALLGQLAHAPMHSRQPYKNQDRRLVILCPHIVSFVPALTTLFKIFISQFPTTNSSSTAEAAQADLSSPPPPLCRHGTTTTTICSSTTSGRKACTARGGGRPRTGLHRRTQPHLYQHSPPLLLHAPPLLGYPSSSSSSHPTTAQPKTTTPLIFIYSCLQPLRRPRPRVPTTLRTLPRRQRSPSLHLSFPPHDDARPHPA